MGVVGLRKEKTTKDVTLGVRQHWQPSLGVSRSVPRPMHGITCIARVERRTGDVKHSPIVGAVIRHAILVHKAGSGRCAELERDGVGRRSGDGLRLGSRSRLTHRKEVGARGLNQGLCLLVLEGAEDKTRAHEWPSV